MDNTNCREYEISKSENNSETEKSVCISINKNIKINTRLSFFKIIEEIYQNSIDDSMDFEVHFDFKIKPHTEILHSLYALGFKRNKIRYFKEEKTRKEIDGKLITAYSIFRNDKFIDQDLDNDKLEFENCIFLGDVSISEGVDATFRGCIFFKNIFITSPFKDNIDHITIQSSIIHDTLQFNRKIEIVYITNSLIKDINGDFIPKNLSIKYSETEYINFFTRSFENDPNNSKIEISHSNIESTEINHYSNYIIYLSIVDCSYKNIDIKSKIRGNFYFNFNNSNSYIIDSILLSNIKKLELTSLIVKELRLEDFSIDSEVIIEGVTTVNNFHLYNCYFKGMKIFNSDFSQSLILINKLYFRDCYFTQIKWGHFNQADKKNDQLVEIFRYFKTYYKGESDLLNYHHFYEEEFKAIRRVKGLIKGTENNFIFLMNYFTGFGIQPLRCILILLAWGLICYYFCHLICTVNTSTSHFSTFISFIDLKYSYSEDFTLHFGATFALIQRIILSYLYYQIVASFRKYSLK